MNLGERRFVLEYCVGPTSRTFPDRKSALAQAEGIEPQFRTAMRIVTLEVVAIEPLDDDRAERTTEPAPAAADVTGLVKMHCRHCGLMRFCAGGFCSYICEKIHRAQHGARGAE